MKNKGRKILVAVIGLVALVIGIIAFRGNYLEIAQVGDKFISTYNRTFIYRVISFIINFVFLYGAFYLTNRSIKKGLKVFFDDEKKEMPNFPNKSLCFTIALIGSILTTEVILNRVLLAFSNSQFGISDAVFGFDLSFFVFWKPLIQYLVVYLIVVVVGTIIYAVAYSLIVLNTSFDGVQKESLEKVELTKKLKSRIISIAVLATAFVVFQMIFNIGNESFMSLNLNDGTQYSLNGAGAIDVVLKLVGYVILAILIFVSIMKAYGAIKEGNVRRVIAFASVVPIYLIALAIVLAISQLVFVGSNELDKNYKYIEENIKSTKEAYGIAIDEGTINYSGTITEKEISTNSDILRNVSIVDSKNVLQDIKSTHTSKGYYTYRNTQIGQYNVNGISSLVYLTPREITSENITNANKMYEYTHGYGVLVTMAGSTDEYGNLKTYQAEFDGSDSVINVKEPRIYFGMQSNNAIVTNTKDNEVDYINEETGKEVNYKYTGTAGKHLGFIDRLILAIKEANIELVFPKDYTDESKIIANRNVIQRAKTIMPFMQYDENPYIVINDAGEIYWVIDAYTVTDEYPFSQKSTFNGSEVNYIRNSSKVIINAFTGETKFYITDRTDPIVMAYNNIYPDLFEDKDISIPEDISKHFVYPSKLFEIQSEMLEKYHNVEADVLYRANDVWEIAETVEEKAMKPYYTTVKDENGNLKLGLVIPYTMYGKQTIIAYLVATYESGSSKLKITEFPSDSSVLGVSTLETQISTDEVIAPEIASLNVTGTKITKELIAVPVDNTMVYVQSIYQQLINETNQRPTLMRVVVASGNKIAIGRDLQTALANLLSQFAVDIDVTDGEDVDSLTKAIIRANENMKTSSRNQDWKLYGEDLQELTSLIEKLDKVIKAKEEQKAKDAVAANALMENTVAE